MSKSIPIIADKKPIKVDLESGKNYFWCRCGKSQKQPFCGCCQTKPNTSQSAAII